jgi:diadenosine tetraphosphate (Ap4A) HIT family hydrolase
VSPVTDSLYSPDCSLCPDNGKVDIIAECDDAYVVQALIDGRKAAHCYLIIPRQHITSILDLPATWQPSMKDMLIKLYCHVNVAFPHNLSWNIGRAAGQRQEHIHMWVVFRGRDSVDQTELGLAGLIHAHHKLEIQCQQLERRHVYSGLPR